MKSLYIQAHAKDAASLAIGLQELDTPEITADEVLVEIKAAGVNASDALAAIGYFDHAKTPRIPGRDFAGTIVKGPKELIGENIWGTEGTAGIDFNGTHTQYMALPISAVATIPTTLSLEQAGSVTLPYVTAYYAIVKRSQLSKGKSCLVIGALGQVGRAAMAIAHWLGANPVAVVRGEEELKKAQAEGLKAVDSTEKDFEQQAIALNNGKAFDVILNSVGTILWKPLLKALAKGGHLATISAPPNHRIAEVSLFELYRANQTLVGVNTVPLDFNENAALLNALKPGFESGQLTAPREDEIKRFTMEQATEAYQAVLDPTIKERIVLIF
ncbi:MAG: hypothetical protein COV52_03730 [Gammaproteobacteria bacterium CG11_big_fil_rev_8_21_14_0_20_46_22]|nr:MAG: hypothetical protein COW05_04550 [Gammaproteobacteria bacterium CG12_big_fil_rev_8_21_14_0_65_46_12]PIR11430.1 MAG: hypothetical protein COV52_03730 [Gammaproteobacteria bacterium CG11_big_fil_rev_8_21_14_0_20_46_22]